MSFLRASRAAALIRAARPTVARPQSYRQIARRTYASGSHEAPKSSGDALWASVSIGVTVPICWYLLKNGPEPVHGHDDHGDSHGKRHEEQHEEEESKDEGEGEEKSEEKSDEGEEKSEDGEGEKKAEAKSDDSEDKADDKDSEKSEDSESGDEEKTADTPDTSDDEGESESKDTPDDNNTRKSIPDAKGGSKKRLESDKGDKQGEGSEDESATSRPAKGKNTQSGKQEGLSNTDTKHSTDIGQDSEKSSKPEGPESAKIKGSVDPGRSQV